MEGKWKAEGKRGTRKSPRVVAEERVERSWKEDSGLLLGAEVARAIWQLGDRLTSVAEELAASREAIAEESRLLRRVLVCNLRQIEMAFEGWGGRDEENNLGVEGSGEAEDLGEWVEEQME